ncbi:MAG: hypothetical protein IPM46_08410 [Flavobacteriales bacterium]|nr:hypothetical protein [Flavobacteriales bacterium]
MTTRYKNLAHFLAAKAEARRTRDVHAGQLAERWALLKDPDTRGVLLRDAMGDMLRNWAPYRRVHELLHGRISGSTVAAVGMAVASTRQGFFKRMLYTGVSVLLGKVIGEKEEKGPGLLSTLATAIGSMRQRMRERKAEREEAQAEVEASDRE